MYRSVPCCVALTEPSRGRRRCRCSTPPSGGWSSTPGGPLLVLAGPGTGKTTTLVETAVARVEAGVPVEQS